MDKEVKQLIKEHINLVDEERFQELYGLIPLASRNELTTLLMDCGVKPDNFMTSLPVDYLACNYEIESYQISPTIKQIENKAFYCCENLEHVDIPDSVTTIGEGAFFSCGSLLDITIPKNIMTIGGSAFEGCSNLKSLFITDIESWLNAILVNIRSHPFVASADGTLYVNGKNANNLVIPGSVKRIGPWSLLYCTNINVIKILPGVHSIGNGAFDSCINLTSITIPNTVGSIGADAFFNCQNLINISFEGTIKQLDNISHATAFMGAGVRYVNCIDGRYRFDD